MEDIRNVEKVHNPQKHNKVKTLFLSLTLVFVLAFLIAGVNVFSMFTSSRAAVQTSGQTEATQQNLDTTAYEDNDEDVDSQDDESDIMPQDVTILPEIDFKIYYYPSSGVFGDEVPCKVEKDDDNNYTITYYYEYERIAIKSNLYSTTYFTVSWAGTPFAKASAANSDSVTDGYFSGIATAGVADVGTYTNQMVCTLKPNYAWSNGKTDNLTVTVVVLKRTIEIPSLIGHDAGNDNLKTSPYSIEHNHELNLSFTPGDYQMLTFNRSSTATLVADTTDVAIGLYKTSVVVGHSAGTYTVTVTLKNDNKNNVTWADGSNGSFVYTLDIVKFMTPMVTTQEQIVGGDGISTPYYAKFFYDGDESYKTITFYAPEGFTFLLYGETATSEYQIRYKSSISTSAVPYWTFEVSADKTVLKATYYKAAVTSGVSLHELTLYTASANCLWEEGEVTSLLYSLEIVKAEVDKPMIEGWVEGHGDGTVDNPYYIEAEYDGTYKSFTITGINATFMKLTALTSRFSYEPIENMVDGRITFTRLSETVASAGNYMVHFTPVSATWAGTDGSVEDVYYKIVIVPKQIAIPMAQNGSTGSGTSTNPYLIQKQFDGTLLVATFLNFDNTIIKCSVSGTTSNPQTYDEVNKIFTIAKSSALGTYDFNFALANANYCWEGGIEGSIYYRLSITAAKVTAPTMSEHDSGSNTKLTLTYDTQAHEFTFNDVTNGLATYSISSSATTGNMVLASWQNGVLILSATNASVYTVTISLAEPANTLWADTNDTAAKTFIITINKAELAVPQIVGNNGSNTITFGFTGDPQQVQISGIIEDLMSISVDANAVDKGVSGGVLTFEVTDAKTYTTNVTIKDFNNYKWQNSTSDTIAYTASVGSASIAKPYLQGDSTGTQTTATVDYSAAGSTMTIQGVTNAMTYTLPAGMTVVSYENDVLIVSAVNVGTYTLTIGLANSNYTWVGGSTANVSFKLTINRALIDVPYVDVDGGIGYSNTTIEAQYTGDWIFLSVHALSDGSLTWANYTGYPELEFVSWQDDLLVLRAKDVGLYRVNITHVNTANTGWNKTTEANLSLTTSTAYYKLQITRKLVDVPYVDTDDGIGYSSTTINAIYTGDWIYLNVHAVSDGTLTWSNREGYSAFEFVSWEDDLLVLRAKAVGLYRVDITQVNTTNTEWNKFDGDNLSTGISTAYYRLQISELKLAVPYIEVDGQKEYPGYYPTVEYDGEWHYLYINTPDSQYLTWANRDGYAEFEFVSWEDNLLVLRAKEVGSYRIDISHKDTGTSRWDLTTGTGVSPSTEISVAYFRLAINKKVIAAPVLADDSDSGTNLYKDDYYYVKINNVLEGAFTYTFTGTEMELVSWQDGTIIFRAKDVAAYAVKFSQKDTAHYSVADHTTGSTFTFKLSIEKVTHIKPAYVGDKTAVYDGTYHQFVIQNIFKQYETYTAPASVQELSWTDDGVLTLGIKDVGSYAITINIIDTVNTKWTSTSVTSVTITFSITVKAITASIKFYSTDGQLQGELDKAFADGSLPSWPAGAAVWAVVTLNGLCEEDHPDLDIYYYFSGDSTITYPLYEDLNMGIYYFKMPEKYAPGTHATVVKLATSSTVANYKMSQTTQKFVINTGYADFEDSDLVWQYKNGTTSTVVYASMGAADNPLVLPYNGSAYSFSITKTAAELQTLGVKISSYTGDTAATEAGGVYCAKVTIAAYSTKYYYPTKTFEIYYTISKVKIDLSGVKWNYSSPLTYTGNALNVYINGATLPAGLSIKGYLGDVNMINATEGTGIKYSTTVEFAVSTDSYYLPDMNDPDSYNGTFNWTIEWEVNKAIINVVWKNGQLVTNDGVFEVPVLSVGNGFVNYSFEQQDDDGSYFAIDELVKIMGKAVNYRVLATLKDGTGADDEVDYTQNYILVVNDSVNNPNPMAFTIGKDQYPVQVGVEINGEIIDINDSGVSTSSFPYTGNQYVVKPVVFGGDLTIDKFTVTYYSQSSVKGSLIPPTDVGVYRVVISITYKTSSNYDSEDYYIEGNDEFEFEITKATFDTSGLKWQYSHNGVVVATYDSLQGKWLDNMGREVAPIAYDGTPYTLSLLGANSIPGLSIRLSGNIETDVGTYIAHADFTYNSDNYNKPSFDDFSWTIGKGTLDVSGAHWNYEEAFTYDYVGGNAVSYKVELVGLPEYLQDKISYITNGVAGNSAYNVGEYVTSFVLGEIDTSRYYDVVWPDNIISEITWEIMQKRLFNIEYEYEMGDEDTEDKVAWVFDATAHNLMYLFGGIDESLSEFYNIIIEYAYDNMTFAAYGGYAGNKFSAMYAGTYRVTFAIKDGINNETTNVVWGNGRATNQYYRVLVSKATITIVSWNENAEDSTINIDKGSIFAGLFKYSYLDATERIVPIDYIYNSVGGETFYVKPVLKAEFANSVEYVFATDVPEMLAFVTEEPEVQEEPPVFFDKPEVDNIVIDFDNLEHTLQISDWISNWDDLQQYMEIIESESDSLTQRAVGDYTVVLRFKKDAYVSWTTGNDAIFDKSTITLTFSIVTKVVEIPEISDYTYTGNVIVVSDNFDDNYSIYVTLISGYQGTNAGTYTLVISLRFPQNSTWSDGTTEDKYITWNIAQAKVELSKSDTILTFDGSEHNVSELLNGYNSSIMSISPIGSHAIDAGDYTATITLTNSNYVWADGSDAVTINWSIEKVKVTKPSIDSSASIIYDGEAHNVTSVLVNYNPNLMIIIAGQSKGTNANTYSITISLPSSNYVWDDDTADLLNFDWVIEQRVINIADIANTKFDNIAHSILQALGLTSDDLNYVNLTAMFNSAELTSLNWYSVGHYSVVVTIDSAFNQAGNNVIFADNTTDTKTITFEVEKVEVNVIGWNKDQENSTAKFDSPIISSDMIDYVIVDADGNEVTKDDVAAAEDGTEFTISFVLNPQYANNISITFPDDELRQYTFKVGEEVTPEDPSVVEIPTISDTEFTGEEIDIWQKIYYKFDGRVEVVSGNTATNVGNYTVVLALVDKENTSWSDGSTDDIEVAWKIIAKKLTVPTNNNSFTIFDNTEHNLADICGMTDYLKFLNVSVTFNGSNLSANANGAFMAKNNGTYIVSFEIRSELNGESINVCWEDDTTETKSVEIEVSKLVYNVTGWDEDNQNSTIKADDVVIDQGVLDYVITDADGNVVSAQDVIDAQGQGKTFTIKVSVKDEFADNVELSFAEGVSDTYQFTTSLDEVSEDLTKKPTISDGQLVYDGNEHGVQDVIADFDENKMEYSQDSQLVGTNADTYTVTIRLKDGYTWLDGSTDELTLEWTIYKAQISGSWNEDGDYPVFETSNLNDQDKINVYYYDNDGNKVWELKAGQEYIAKVELKDSDNYELNGDTEKTFASQQDIELPEDDITDDPTDEQSKLFIVIDANTTFVFVDGSGATINYAEHTYNVDTPNYLKNIAIGDSLADIAAQFKNVGIKFFDNNGSEITSDLLIATGMKLRLYDEENITDELILVVKGDINGDGRINALDKATLNAYTIGSTTLLEPFLLAADVNEDGRINALDKATLNAYTIGTVQFFEGLSVHSDADVSEDETEQYFNAKLETEEAIGIDEAGDKLLTAVSTSASTDNSNIICVIAVVLGVAVLVGVMAIVVLKLKKAKGAKVA